jgi:ankyrin repeat protein
MKLQTISFRRNIVLPVAVLLALQSCTTTKKTVKTVSEPSVQQLIEAGKTDEVRNLFKTKYDINAADENGDTALHVAARKNDADIITYLITKGAGTELKNYNGDTPLHVAIKNDCFEAARVLAAIGSDIFARDGNGKTALETGLSRNEMYYDILITTNSGELRDSNGETIVHYFVRTKNAEAVAYCIKKKLPLAVKNDAGKTPLDLALENNTDYTCIKIAADLILAGVDLPEGDYSYFENAVASRNLSERLEDGQTPLHIAAIMGHTGIAQYLTENSAALTAQDISGATPLHEAVRYGRSAIVGLLLDSGADPNALDSLGNSPLLLIIPREYCAEIYDQLLSHGADPNIKDMYGDTPLHIATMTALPVDILEKLTAVGADVNSRNKQGVTPLAVAVEHNLFDQVSFYTAAGADIHADDTEGNTPLKRGLDDSMRMLQTLVTTKNVNTLDSKGNSPLLIAIQHRAPIEKIKYILSLDPNVNIRNSDGNSALNLVVQNHRQDIGELLLAHNADIFSANKDNTSPLRITLEDDSGAEDWLLTSGTISAADGSGNTALHYAADWGLKNAVRKLLEKGCDPNARNANGETALFNAVKNDATDILSLLADGGADIKVRDHLGSTPLHIAVRWNAQQCAKELISKGLAVNAQNMTGKTPLAEAAITGNTTMVSLLLENGANPNAGDSYGRTVLDDAIRAKNTAVIKLLLAEGANPKIQDMNGRNAYHEAAATGVIEIITMIRKTGANPLTRDKSGVTPFSISLSQNSAVMDAVLGDSRTVTDSDGNTPVHTAVENNAAPAVLSFLLEKGYPSDTRNAKGYTPLALAVEKSRDSLCILLLQNGADPFAAIDRKGSCALTLALDGGKNTILGYIVQYAGTKTDMKGNTILHYAAKTASKSVIERLLSLGLDPHIKNLSGETSYDTAISWGRKDIADLLQ